MPSFDHEWIGMNGTLFVNIFETLLYSLKTKSDCFDTASIQSEHCHCHTAPE